jgi:GNAT superfamily N-acetyltransferase
MERQHHVVWNANHTEVLEAGIRLSFEQCDEDRPRSGQVPAAVFCGYHDGHSQRTSLTGGHLGRGSIYIPEGWRGRHLGTFAMSAVVRWAQQWPAAAIEPITLADGDGDPENKDRRNRFYEQFGLRFTYDDEDRRAGGSLPITAADLVDSSAWEGRVEEHRFLETFAKHLDRGNTAERDLAWQTNEVRKLHVLLARDAAHPIRAAAKGLWNLYPNAWVYALMTGTFMFGLWRQFH